MRPGAVRAAGLYGAVGRHVNAAVHRLFTTLWATLMLTCGNEVGVVDPPVDNDRLARSHSVLTCTNARSGGYRHKFFSAYRRSGRGRHRPVRTWEGQG